MSSNIRAAWPGEGAWHRTLPLPTISFNTGEYPLGSHTFTALGTTPGGDQICSPDRTVAFISAEEGWETAGKIVVPLLALVLVISLLGTVGPMLLGRKASFRLGEYGVAGGAVCPRCSMPFSRHLMSPNMVFGKLERCPHCGKWAIVAGASADALRQAEARWKTDSRTGELQPETEGDRLSEQIDESRYET